MSKEEKLILENRTDKSVVIKFLSEEMKITNLSIKPVGSCTLQTTFTSDPQFFKALLNIIVKANELGKEGIDVSYETMTINTETGKKISSLPEGCFKNTTSKFFKYQKYEEEVNQSNKRNNPTN